MKAPMTRDRYKTRVSKFFDFIGLNKKDQTVEDKAFITRTLRYLIRLSSSRTVPRHFYDKRKEIRERYQMKMDICYST
jgi:hypothetical protein